LIEDAALLGWGIHISACEGCVAALNGTEIHVEFKRTGVITRRKVREFLGPLIDQSGFLTTRCEAGDSRSRRFIEKIGFQFTWADDRFEYFLLDRLPFSKG
jgi:hypothetical protein